MFLLGKVLVTLVECQLLVSGWK